MIRYSNIVRIKENTILVLILLEIVNNNNNNNLESEKKNINENVL